MQVAALEAEGTAAAAAASVAKSAAAASEERLGGVARKSAAACRAQQVRHYVKPQALLYPAHAADKRDSRGRGAPGRGLREHAAASPPQQV